jgi:membrane protease subunit (stomatin/prohibitin family)
VDLSGLDQQVDGAADQVRIESLASAVEGRDGAAEDLLGVGLGIIVGFYRAADIRRAAGQALRQLQLEFGVAADAERTAETVDRRFADRCGLGEGGDTEPGGLLWVEQDHLGDFAFGLVQLFKAILDLFQ